MSIDKSIRADYAIQGGGPNYLGKQEMVRAPKKWQSSPDHEPAELAYITEKEKDILIDLDLYGSLNGKPNRGPSGIISLQGDMGSVGGGGSSGGGGGGGGGGGNGAYQDRIQQIAAAQNRAAAASRAAEQQAAAQRDMQATIAQAEKAEANRVAQQAAEGKVDVGFQEALKKTADARQREEEFLQTGDLDVLTDLTGFDTAPKVDVKDIMGEVTDPGSVSYDPTYKTPAEIRTLSQDPDYGQFFRQPTVIEAPKRSGLTTALNIASWAMPFLKVPKEVATGVKMAKTYSDIKNREGIYGTAFNLAEKAGFNPNKLTSNLTSTIEKAKGRQFDPKDPIGWTGEQKRNKTFHEPREDGERVDEKTTVEEAIAGKTSLGAGALGLPELQKRMAILHQLKQNEGFWNQLNDVQKRNINMAMMNYFKMIDQYSVKTNEGRIRDIG